MATRQKRSDDGKHTSPRARGSRKILWKVNASKEVFGKQLMCGRRWLTLTRAHFHKEVERERERVRVRVRVRVVREDIGSRPFSM
jgi:hypothetical protein